MKNLLFLSILVSGLLIGQSTADAALLINESWSGGGSYTDIGSSNYTDRHHGVAEDFTVSSGDVWSISSVASYFTDNGDGYDNKTMRFYVFSDNGSGGIGTPLYSADYALPMVGGYAWRGISGLSWELSSGDYWMGVRAIDSSGIRTRFLGDARMVYDDGAWSSESGGNIGLQIEGSVVPIPGAVWLFASGLIGLVGIRRRLNT
jgi:hypothetical protein